MFYRIHGLAVGHRAHSTGTPQRIHGKGYHYLWAPLSVLNRSLWLKTTFSVKGLFFFKDCFFFKSCWSCNVIPLLWNPDKIYPLSSFGSLCTPEHAEAQSASDWLSRTSQGAPPLILLGDCVGSNFVELPYTALKSVKKPCQMGSGSQVS